MRLAVISDEISTDLDTALDVCEELGVTVVELRQVGDDNVVWHDHGGLNRIRESLRAGGFTCPVIASPFMKTDPPDVQWEALERSFIAAHALGAGIVRTFGWLREENPEQRDDQLVEVLGEAWRRSAAAGLSLALENEHACNIATGQEARRILDRVPELGLGAIWDPGNQAILGSTPFPNGYEAVRERVMHVHVKDVRDRTWVKIGTGVIDYAGQLRALDADGYGGCLSVETHYRLRDGDREGATRENVAALREVAAAAGVTVH
jgi:sugar phosphate isomerase/epimerase